ncbi:MAG: hypothetical protein HZB29_00630 [Nitrospinae bacterium]|nr:hypothetical protein [Nitrospinota bacterium]
MIRAAAYYLGRAMQVMGMLTAAASLIAFFNVDGQMGTMMKLAGAGLAEFYIGYGLIVFGGVKG